MVKYNPSESEEKTLTAEEAVTPELNPALEYVSFVDQPGTEHALWDKWRGYDTPILPYDHGDVVLDFGNLRNHGDETIDFRVVYDIGGDGEAKELLDIVPGGRGNLTFNISYDSPALTAGIHTISWSAYARKSSETTWEAAFITGSTTYTVEAPPAHDTALSIAVTDEAGNPITESVVGETVYITGQLKDIVDDVALQGASITLYRNGVATGKTDVTNASGVYSIPYTVVSGDVPSVRFKTVFEGA